MITNTEWEEGYLKACRFHRRHAEAGMRGEACNGGA